MNTNIRKELLKLIEKNSKVATSELSKMLGVSEADVLNEMSELEKEHIICGYLTLIDWDKTDVEKVIGLIEVKVTPQRGQGFDKIAERIYNYPEVSSVYLISGAYDLLVTLEENSLKEIAQFVSDKLSTLDTVLSTATHFILKKYKDHGIVFDSKHEDEREVIS
ncbi:MAG: Lrp/AsnC family transcriptional regulator [Lachnospiraceae bacterium]|nr:Lrp/AsnC family transcriptional regulator [Lachnospiraceae bacterium]